LEAAFLGEVPAGDRSRFGPDLSGALSAACARGRAAFAEIPLDDDTFVRHLARAATRISDGAELATLAVEDLYLACACVVGARGAASALMTLHGAAVRRCLERSVPKGPVDEIEQGFLADLLVGSGSRPPEIAAYAGRSPLIRWMEVVAQRCALRWLRSERIQAGAAARAALEPSLGSTTPMDIVLFRDRYGSEFEEALKEALKNAPERDRAILRLYIVNGVSLDKIGKLLGVSQATASRWLAKARESVLADLKSILKQRLRIASAEVESLGSLLASHLDLSISLVLKADDPAPTT
jgi:RNA polymerase sigma-70 factor (ECF subfamily)